MLKGEAINKAKRWRGQLKEGEILPNREEMIQFLDVAIWEMERRVPTKPISERLYEEEIGKVGYDNCPNCHNIVSGKYCMFCGQVIDWSEDECS